VRLFVSIAAMALLSCTPAPPPVKPPPPDPTREAWYGEAVDQLTALNRNLDTALRRRQSKEAAHIVEEAEPLVKRLLATPRPTLAAMEASSDFDDLYGRLLLANRQVGFARFQFQKNVARWRNWKPQTDESARRLKAAESAIADCDRRMTK
jgi:hypothetical protein